LTLLILNLLQKSGAASRCECASPWSPCVQASRPIEAAGRCGSALLDDRPRVARQQQLPVCPPRRDAVGHHALVELAQVETGAGRCFDVAAQPESGELPK
jgi:hypothetical protein